MPGFVRECWYVAGWARDLPAGTTLARRMLDTPVLVFRTASGAIAALEDWCPHRLAPLSMGRVTGEAIQCLYHGLAFGTDGACVHNPHGNGARPAALKARALPVAERHSLIWVWMGKGAADKAAIPDLGFVDAAEERHISAREHLRIEADWRAISDNLLDLSHTSFVHEGILGNLEMIAAAVRVVAEGDRVTVHRDPVEAPTPGMFVPLLSVPRARSLKWNALRWLGPAAMVVDTGVCAPDERPERGTGYHGLHLLTPETDRTTHYFFSSVRWNPLTDPSQDQAIAQHISRNRRFAFEAQDTPIIEAQQRVRDELGDRARPTLLATIDEGPVRMQRIIDRLIARET